MSSYQLPKFLFISLCVIFSCSNTTHEQPVTANTSDSLKAQSGAKETPALLTPEQCNQFARFIAGLPQLSPSKYSPLEKDSVWIKHANRLNSKWNLMKARRTDKLVNWAAREVPEAMRKSDVIFYPFSGPDILNANLLFPQAKAYYMFGLEPVGNLPDVLLNTQKNDSLRRYFNALNVSLNAITNFSFFRTKSMDVDFKADDLNGTIHLLLLFLSRNGNDITSIHYITLAEDGTLADNSNRKAKSNEGVEIAFKDSTGQNHTVTFFSVNLDNAHFNSNKNLQAFIKHLGNFDTYLKAASYLMHNASFSGIRAVILAQTHQLLQDDSGIPFRFFSDKSKWDVSLYGKYVPPIPLFANYFQEDLKKAYSDSTITRKDLNFGIGYNFKNSNLLLATKK